MEYDVPKEKQEEQCNCPDCVAERNKTVIKHKDEKIDTKDKEAVTRSYQESAKEVKEVLDRCEQDAMLFIAMSESPGDKDCKQMACLTLGTAGDQNDLILVAISQDAKVRKQIIGAVAMYMAKKGALTEALMLAPHIK